MDETRPTDFGDRLLDQIWMGVAKRRDQRLGDLAVQRGFLTAGALERLIHDLPAGTTIGEYLVAENVLTASQLAELEGRSGADPPQVAIALQDPKRCVDHYVLVEEIGRGGMGIVWRAWDRKLHRWVAFKTLRVEGAGHVHLRFQREAQAMARLHHPHIAAVHDVGGTETAPYLVMELVDGKALDVHAPIRDVAAILRKAALGLQEAHRAGVVHRDLKPGNILVDEKGEPRVVDFGLAQLVDSDLRFTRTGAVIGTPLYMAPEQIAGDSKSQGPRTDVFALGAILYEAMAGDPPFTGKSVAEIHDRILRSEATVPQGPADLATICIKAIEKDPGNRYVSAGAFAGDLARFLAGEPIEARPPGTGVGIRRWIRRNRALAGGMAAALLTGLIAWLVLARVHFNANEEIRREAQVKKADRHKQETALRLGETIRTLEKAILEARAAFYNPGADIAALLAAVDERSVVIESLSKEPQGAASADLWLTLGKARFLIGTPDEAARALTEALRLDSSLGEAEYYLGKIAFDRLLFLRLGTFGPFEPSDLKDRTREWLDRGTRTWKNAPDIDRRAMEIMGLLVQDRFEECREACEAAFRQFGRAFGVEEIVLIRSLPHPDPKERLRLLNEALAIRPHFFNALLFRANLERADAGRAMEDVERAIRINSRFPLAYFVRASLRFQAGDPEGAVADDSECLRLDPTFVPAYHNRATQLRSLKRYPEAIASFSEALRLVPAAARAWVLLDRGVAYEASGDFPAAIADLDEVITLEPRNAKAWFARGNVHKKRQEFEKAIADYSKTIDVDSQYWNSFMNRANTYHAMGLKAEALKDYRHLLQHAPADWPQRRMIEDSVKRIEAELADPK